MPTLVIEISDKVAEVLARQADALLLRRNAYVRAVLAAVASRAEHRRKPQGRARHRRMSEKKTGPDETITRQ